MHELKKVSPKTRQIFLRDSAAAYIEDLDQVLDFSSRTLALYEDHELEAFQINTAWGQNYDIEQLMEHAIVHVLRHRRQIENFKLTIRQ